MGLNLTIFSNHKISGNTFEKRINQIELSLNLEIKDINPYSSISNNIPKKTKSLGDVFFYNDLKTSKEWFERCNEILIYSNYQYLSHLTFYNRITTSCPDGLSYKWSRWTEHLGDKYFRKSHPDEYLDYNNRWKLFQNHNNSLVKQLGGDKIIYFHDGNFQSEQNLLYEGLDLEKGISKMKKNGNFFKLEMLYKNYESIWMEEDCYAFFRKLKK
jgi:hypothetical protein